MARWKYVFCFIFIANVGICGLIANDLVQEVFLKNKFATDQICPLDHHDRPNRNVVDTVSQNKLKGKEILEAGEEKLVNLEDTVLNTLKVVLKKVKDEISEESRQFIDEYKPESTIQPTAPKPTDVSVSDPPNKPEKEAKSTKDSITANGSVVLDSLESSSSINVQGPPSVELEEEARLLKNLKALDSKFMSKDAQNEKGEIKKQQVVDPLSDYEQTHTESLNKTIGTSSQMQNFVERPAAPWVPPKTASLNISKATLSNDDQQQPHAPDGEREAIGTSKIDEEINSPANETEAPVLLPPEGNATSDLVLPTKETTPPGVTPDDVQKDLLETYSQFAERVTAEKKNGATSSNGHSTNGQLAKGPKVKTKNYASTDCGAKFIAANPESSHSHKIMNSNKDEYMLNKCTGKIWAIVELCESIRPQKFDIANFELFSNSPKSIFLFGSHRYPTREWSSLGAYEGEEGNRDVQSFSVDTQEFFKFIKLEIHSYYGTEFFCPLSAFKIYGLSEFEVIEDTEDVEEEEVILEDPKIEESKDKPGMIPNVIKSVVSGVLEVIKRGSLSGNMTDEPEMNTFTQSCRSLDSNFAIPEKCPFAESLNYILACYYDEYLKLISMPIIASVVQNDHFCCRLATVVCASPMTDDRLIYDSVCNNSYACVMLSPKHVLAMCHMYNTELWEEISCNPESETFQPAPLNLSGPVKNAENSLRDDQPSTPSQDSIRTDVTPDKAADVIVDEEGSPAVPPHSAKTLLHPSPGETTEATVIHLPPIDPKPKDSLKKTKEPPSSLYENLPNATLGPVDKATNHNADKKERKGLKESAEKSQATDDAYLGTPGNLPSTPTPSAAVTEGRVGSHPNKESVVVRLSNKIKVLEHNMSISSQYLEELSRRYKRQMEEMQRQFNITILALNSTSQTAYERDLYHQKRLETLENHLEKMSIAVSLLVEEKESILTRVVEQHMILLFVEFIFMFVVFSFLVRRWRVEAPRSPGLANHVDKVESAPRYGELSPSAGEGGREGTETPSLSRRRSVDSIRSEVEGKTKERRLSGDLAMKGSYKDLLITTTTTTKEKKRKKKRNQLKRSLSNASIPENERLPLASKKDKKLEKLKRSSAGVLFSGEGRRGGEYRDERTREEYEGNLNGDLAKENNPAEWQIIKKGKSKSKMEPSSLAEPYAFSSDLTRGKIILDKDLGGSLNMQQYYTEMPFVHGIHYGGESFDIESEDINIYSYQSEVTSPTQAFNDAYLSDVTYGSPVVNDYYCTREMLCYPATKKTSVQDTHRLEDTVNGSFWETTKSPGVVSNSPASLEFRSPTSFKGRTKLRSDNWEWYSSQPSRLTGSNGTTEMVSNSSSDSSVKSKVPIKGTKNETIKFEKRKKKKCKALKLANGNCP